MRKVFPFGPTKGLVNPSQDKQDTEAPIVPTPGATNLWGRAREKPKNLEWKRPEADQKERDTSDVFLASKLKGSNWEKERFYTIFLLGFHLPPSPGWANRVFLYILTCVVTLSTSGRIKCFNVHKALSTGLAHGKYWTYIGACVIIEEILVLSQCHHSWAVWHQHWSGAMFPDW